MKSFCNNRILKIRSSLLIITMNQLLRKSGSKIAIFVLTTLRTYLMRWIALIYFVNFVGLIISKFNFKMVFLFFSIIFTILGLSSKIECMNLNCHLICPKQFVLEILASFNEKAKSSKLILKYEQMYFRDLVNSHPYLRWCPGKDCSMVVHCVANKGYRVICTRCESSFWYFQMKLLNLF